MANTKQKGSDVLIKVGATPTVVAGQRNCTISRSAPHIDATNKDDGNNTDGIPGRVSTTITGSGLVLMDDSAGTIEAQIKAIRTAITTRATIAIEVALGAGTAKEAGTGIIERFDIQGNDEEVVLGDWEVYVPGGLTLTEAM